MFLKGTTEMEERAGREASGRAGSRGGGRHLRVHGGHPAVRRAAGRRDETKHGEVSSVCCWVGYLPESGTYLY